MRVAIICTLLCACLVSENSAGVPLEDIYGPSDLVAVSGNGGLTVGVNGRGRLSLFRWPSPSFSDHLSYRTVSRELPRLGVLPGHGSDWGVRFVDEILWLSDEAWVVRQDYLGKASRVVRTVATLPDSPVKMTQLLFVSPDDDVLVIHITIEGVEERPALFWYANFTPCTRLLPEVPLSDWAFDSLNDFAAFESQDGSRVFHFRPRQPSRADWELAEGLAASNAREADWAFFRDGVWIACGSMEPVAAIFSGGGEVTPSEAVARMESDPGPGGAVGETYSVMRLEPRKERGAYTATLVVAAGPNYRSASSLLDKAMEPGYDKLYRDRRMHDFVWLRESIQPSERPVSERVDGVIRQAILTLSTSMDRSSGAVVRSPAVQPPLGRDWPRYGAWVTYAFDLAGYTDLAQKHLNFYVKILRTEPRPGIPAGSLPAAVYANGVEAVSDTMVDVESVGWTLWSLYEHVSFLEEVPRATFIKQNWSSIVSATEFIVSWADGRSGAPFQSYDPEVRGDRVSPNLVVALHLGLDSALKLAALAGVETEEFWRVRKAELDVVLRNLFLDESILWGLEQILPFALGELGERGEVAERLSTAALARLAAVPGLSGEAGARALCDLALFWKDDAEKLSLLSPLAEGVFLRALTSSPYRGGEMGPTPAFPDTYVSSLCIIASAIIFGPPI